MSLSSSVVDLASRIAAEMKALATKHPTVVSSVNGVYPARPANAVQVIWKGATDPGTASLDGDWWVQV